MRSRVPSTTLACTLTVSPARSAGTFCFCCSFSSCWMTFMSRLSSVNVVYRMTLRSLLPAPLPDSRVVAREQHVGDAHAPVLGRPCELRAARQVSTERVLHQRVRVSDDAGDQAPDRVDQHHRRDLAAAQHVVADRDLVRGQTRAHAIVDALVSAADDDQTGLLGELFRQALVQAPAPGLEQHDGAGVVEHHALDRLEHRLGLHHHAGPATERDVVHLAVAVVREVAEVVRLELDEPALDRAPDHALPEDRSEHVGEDGDDVESHRLYASSTWTSQSATTTRPASRSTWTTASLVAGMRCSSEPSRLTQTSLAGRSSTSAMVPRP